MSFYNMLHGVNPTAGTVLEMLGLAPGDCGRFRDAYITREGELAVYTRNGGGNREDYEDVFEALSQHPNYLRDEDDDFDCTYATIYFSVPDDRKAEVDEFLRLVAEQDRGDLVATPAEKFQQTLDSLK